MTPVIVGLLVALTIAVFMYIDSRLFDTPKDKVTYLKNMALGGGIAALLVYLAGGNLSLPESGLSLAPTQTGGNLAGLGFIESLNQEVLTGVPNF